MIIISDTSPIIHLAAIGQLHLLPALFGKIIIPPMVFEEIVVAGSGQAGAEEIKNASWIEVLPCSNQELVRQFLETLDPGEAEAIALAVEIQPDAILLDDLAARKAAELLGLPFTGLLGVLVQAKKRGLVFSLRPILKELTEKTSFRLSRQVMQTTLNLAGE